MERPELLRQVVAIYAAPSELWLFTDPAGGRAEGDRRLGTQHLCKAVLLVLAELSSGSYKSPRRILQEGSSRLVSAGWGASLLRLQMRDLTSQGAERHIKT